MTDELTPEEVNAELFGPHTIYAPDGTTFVVRAVLDAESVEHVLDPARLQYEVTGPGESGSHLWLANNEGEILDNPAQADPVPLTIKARTALQGWIRMKDELAEHLF